MPSSPPDRQRPARRRWVETVDDACASLRYLEAIGCRGFDCDPQSLERMAAWGIRPLKAAETLADIRKDLGDCRRCGLARGRKHLVFGAGDARARLVFVGEGPGFEEDQKGLPFVGAAGQLLTKIIAAIGYTREQVYICNIIKCRPPGNRNPLPAEIEACKPFLMRQLAAIRPQFICALGTFAAQTLLETRAPISQLRGTFHSLAGIQVLPTYHPAFLLRNPEKKRDVWEDMKRLMQAMTCGKGPGA